MKVLAWNVRWGGQDRASRIASAIERHAPDVVVLSEYQPVGSAPLLSLLHTAGWPYHVTTTPPPRRGGLAVLSRMPLQEQPRPSGLSPFDRHYMSIALPDQKVELRAVYGPLHKDPHDVFWEQFLGALQADAAQDVLVIGDFNSGASSTDSPVTDVFCAKHFQRLPEIGYRDLWRAHAGADAREHTWQGPKNPYRLDHAFGSPSLARRTTSCRYSHAERLDGISDHSVLLAEIDAPAL
ncbi:MAG: endonuclease/exonuclease/phosphatase family protein [Kofleriaceae bacterium]